MKFASSSRSIASVLFCACLAAALVSCSNQAEGERCELANGNEDCETGLTCKTLQSLSGEGEGAICCPDSNPSVAQCRLGNLGNLDKPGTSSPEDAGGTPAEPTKPSKPAAEKDASATDAGGADAAATKPVEKRRAPADGGSVDASAVQ
ncbi:MAG: hypothetical protein RJA70_2284 [Pseudomonadota bacterium]|jgi:hypothetical protein